MCSRFCCADRPSGVGEEWPASDLLLETGDADLEELVEVAREDRQEADALEQRIALVLGI